MKRNVLFALITAVLFCCFTTAVGQNDNEHLKFKGVSIDGTLNSFVNKLKAKGFTYVGKQDGVTLLGGDFASYKNCLVGITTYQGKDLVCKVVVIFPNKDTWSALSNNYFTLKELLTQKYGEPTTIIEEFQGYEPDSDYSKMHKVKFDECKYGSVFETDNGFIELIITHIDIDTCFVMLSYTDKINSETITDSAIEDL